MIKSYSFALILVLLGFSFTVTAQEKELPIRFANGNFITGNNISKQSFKKADLQPVLSGNNYFVVIQFSVLPSETEKIQLQNAGIFLNEYIPANAWLATITSSFDFNTAKNFNIVSINSIPSFYKIDPALFSYQPAHDKQDISVFAISFFSSVNKREVEIQLQQMGVRLFSD